MEERRGKVCLMTFIRPHRSGFALSVVLAIISVASGLVPYFAVAEIVNLLISGEMDFSVYLQWGLIGLIAYFARSVFHGLSTRCSHEATFRVLSEMRRTIAEKLTRVPMGYLTATPSGRLKTTMVERIEQMEVPLAHIIPEMTANLLVPVALVVYLFVLDWRMALASLATIPLGMLCYMAQMKEYPKKYAAVMQANKHMNATTVEYVGGIEVIKAFNQSAASYEKFTDAVRQNTRLMLEWMKSTQGYSALMMTLWPAVLIAVLPVGCLLYQNGSLSASDFITIAILSLGIIGPLVAAIFLTDDFSKIATITGEIAAVLEEPELDRPKAQKKLEGHDISLRDVHFAYKDVQVLNGVSLDIKAGMRTALVGPSGSGKSTIAKLIASYWDVSSGRITIGGIDVKTLPPEQVMDLIGYVSQDNFLFNVSVRENIRMGRPEATDEDVEAVAKAAGCHDFIMSLTHGYDTIVGGAGGHLSGGERQRVAIARAMMKNAPIVILDEATSYTDPENEAILQESIGRLTRGKTLIVIAHRLSTITEADQIAVVDDGRIVAVGKHAELVQCCPLYAQMWAAHTRSRGVACAEGGERHV
ncbi:MAG: ABC transporter ATP-binding protein [Peptococcaceae bacterium]|nr:ABC transporter ATP-binding protein [Peptococcaceae bacterium]